MMGTGKSSVGEAVSRRLGSYTFLDTDSTIEAATGTSVAALFESEGAAPGASSDDASHAMNAGEAGFRKVEESVLGQVAAYVRMVVATGGGVVVTKGNWAALRATRRGVFPRRASRGRSACGSSFSERNPGLWSCFERNR